MSLPNINFINSKMARLTLLCIALFFGAVAASPLASSRQYGYGSSYGSSYGSMQFASTDDTPELSESPEPLSGSSYGSYGSYGSYRAADNVDGARRDPIAHNNLNAE